MLDECISINRDENLLPPVFEEEEEHAPYNREEIKKTRRRLDGNCLFLFCIFVFSTSSFGHFLRAVHSQCLYLLSLIKFSRINVREVLNF